MFTYSTGTIASSLVVEMEEPSSLGVQVTHLGYVIPRPKVGIVSFLTPTMSIGINNVHKQAYLCVRAFWDHI
jgi:hypothetical protein